MSEFTEVGSASRPLRVAIVGSGPAGFYTADALYKTKGLHVEVSMFDRLPTPFGLVRGGVAPDHQKIKSVVKVFEKIAKHETFRFYGNVKLGRDIQVVDLVKYFDQIVYAVGNETDRKLKIPGAGLGGVHAATDFVGWYNGHPDHQRHNFDLSNCERVAVIGVGNVAVDVARILAHDPNDLTPTDIADNALQALQKSNVKEVYLIGRRGPVQARFSPKELKELDQINGADLEVAPECLELDRVSQSLYDASGEKSNERRNIETLRAVAERGSTSKPRRVTLKFFSAPQAVIGDGRGRVSALRVEKCRLYEAEPGWLQSEGTGEFEDLPVGMVLAAIGYHGIPIAGVPFDTDKGIIPNQHGRVFYTRSKQIAESQFVVGWMRTGPRGLIGMHRGSSAEVVANMIQDLKAGKVEPHELPPRKNFYSRLQKRGVRFVTFEDWERLDQMEIENGKADDRVRKKFTNVDKMLDALGIE